ncbi:MAG: LytR/AlgR family response regulator transcription factor [Cetobacterium sp.]
MIDIAICCKDFFYINILKDHISKFSNLNNINFNINVFNSFQELENAQSKNYKILLYFINLHNKGEIYDINKKLNSINDAAQIIYIPDFSDFVLHGIHLRNFKVLLKPVDYCAFSDEFKICVDGCNEIYNSNPMSIHFISYLNDRCVAYTAKDYYLISMSINSLEKKLDNGIFFRCNAKCIINLHQIRKITKDYVIINGNTIPVDKDKFTTLKNKLLNILKL